LEYDYFCRYKDSQGIELRPRDLIGVIQRYGGHSLPYTNGSTPGWQRYAYGDTCSLYGPCLDDGDSTRLKSSITNINGDTVKVAGCVLELCTADTLWQKKYVEGTDSILAGSLSSNGQYTDKGGKPILCYRGREHGHPDGGGYYYIQGRKAMIDSIDAHHADHDSIPTANEAGYDTKIGWYDYYANWGGFHGGYNTPRFNRILLEPGVKDVPIFPAVMHEDQATIMGLTRRVYSDTTWYGPNHWVFGLAYLFVNGHMLGFRVEDDSVTDLHDRADSTQVDDYEYVRSLIRKRRDIKRYLVYGEWMRPPTLVSCDSAEIGFFDKDPIPLPAVLTSAFVTVDSVGDRTDSLALIFTNYSDSMTHGSTTADCRASIQFSDYGLSAGDYQICELVNDTLRVDCDTLTLGSTFTKNLSLASDSTAILEFVPLP